MSKITRRLSMAANEPVTVPRWGVRIIIALLIVAVVAAWVVLATGA